MQCKYCGKTLVKDACYKEGKNKFCSELECIKWNTENKTRQSLLVILKAYMKCKVLIKLIGQCLQAKLKIC